MSTGTMKYTSLDLGTIEAVVNKLGGMEGVRRFLCGELSLNIPQFATWKTVKIGVHKNLGAITTMLTKFKVSDLGEEHSRQTGVYAGTGRRRHLALRRDGQGAHGQEPGDYHGDFRRHQVGR
jgi:hypothetical protein